MSGIELTFEVKIRNNGFLTMKHIDAVNHKKASIKARKYGHVVSVRKLDYARPFGDIENLQLNQPPLIEYVKTSQYDSAIAMDEMIWKKKEKRAGRLEKRKEYKNNLDK